eukprot:gb/GEZN01023863.1/.p1 GENE.gb/GEZN01023863.1/~~gb/GEZN01023863.1/.p1  ORF type:complete len:146 (+),score=15.33 gb/GEZN01023863.1/:139-576(+)
MWSGVKTVNLTGFSATSISDHLQGAILATCFWQWDGYAIHQQLLPWTGKQGFAITRQQLEIRPEEVVAWGDLADDGLLKYRFMGTGSPEVEVAKRDSPYPPYSSNWSVNPRGSSVRDPRDVLDTFFCRKNLKRLFDANHWELPAG